jgi:flagellar biosynthesis protein FlhF
MAYGPGAVILSTRTRRKYGFFGPASVDVLACPGDAAERARTQQASLRGNCNPMPPVQTETSGQGLRDTLEQLLKAAGIAPWVAAMLATNALVGGRAPLLSTRQLASELGGALEELMGKSRPVETGAGPGRVVAFIGPPGSGKTTALVKVACELSLAGGQRVALVSADTHRLAATEQLARYAAILGLEFAVAYTPGELRRHCEALSGAGAILVDTAGYVWRSPEDLGELASLLEAASPAEVHLVLPATCDESAAQHAMYAYRPLGVDRLFISGVDEVDSYAPAVNLAAATRLPLSYLGYGSDVPGFLEVADPKSIAPALLSGKPPTAGYCSSDLAQSKGAGAVG